MIRRIRPNGLAFLVSGSFQNFCAKWATKMRMTGEAHEKNLMVFTPPRNANTTIAAQ